MSRRKGTSSAAMLDLWRPPQHAGDAVGCLATTYTFEPALFDEQCLGRFLDIESEPDREDLAFLLERESRLGGVYAGVLVDQRQSGVEHSLRWDILRVRPKIGKQHAKLSLLVWTNHVRIIVASANLTESGYRFNQEVAGSVDLTPDNLDREIFSETIGFLAYLLSLVPGERLPEIDRAEAFLRGTESLVRDWKPLRRRQAIRRQLVFTFPAIDSTQPGRSTLEEMIEACRNRGGSPSETWIASPFFDVNDESSRVTAALCKSMARRSLRRVSFCVPAIRDNDPNSDAVPRLAAPKALFVTPRSYQTDVTIEMLPEIDDERNRRQWHAKMIALHGDSYSALLIGSSNFTSGGMGVGQYRNAEANLLNIADRSVDGVKQLNSLWPEMDQVIDPEAAEWLGPHPELEEEERSGTPLLPAGFLSATYRAGDNRQIVLTFDPESLPEDWTVYACGLEASELLSATRWREGGGQPVVELKWMAAQPPLKLLVKWLDDEEFLPINVEDTRTLPPPTQLQNMTADDMLMILAASDPSAAFRAWVKQQPTEVFDTDLDSATPIDLDPLRRYDLQATFLHRIRRRARILAQVRAKLERPVYGRQALDWRLRGMLGVRPLAERLAREVVSTEGPADEALLTLADFLIVLREVKYQPADGSLTASEFKKEYKSFLVDIATELRSQLEPHRNAVSAELLGFWERVLNECVGLGA